MADRGAAALAERLHESGCMEFDGFCIDGQDADDAQRILGDRGCYLPDGLDALAAKVAALPHLQTLGIDGDVWDSVDRDAVLALIAEAAE